MTKKIVAVNAGPRKGWNTDILVSQAAKGAEESGAEVIRFDLYQLEKFSGCVSCFGCKKETHKGHCVLQDGLTEVLDAIRQADGLIIGTPNYLGDVTAAFRALYERLVFQSLTYNRENPCCRQKEVPVLLIMTSNSPAERYLPLLENYRGMLTRFLGPCQLFACGDTLQLEDYEATDWKWSIFDPQAKKERRETVFPQECRQAQEQGAALVSQA